MTKIEELRELGLNVAAERAEKSIVLTKKLHIAYQNFEFVSEDNIKQFNSDLRKKTEKNDESTYSTTYDKLVFTSIDKYAEIPPAEALLKLKEAKKFNCFDVFEIAKIESIKEVQDPILFGVVNGCGDKFFIAQWDNDMTFEEIKKLAE